MLSRFEDLFIPNIISKVIFCFSQLILMKCPDCNDETTIKAGKRESKSGKIQRYYCKNCEKYFTEKKQSYTQYPLKVIIYTLEQYNKGHSVKEAKKRVGKKYPYSPPTRTIYSWINRYKDKLTFLKLRKEYNIDPDNLTTTHNFQHQQIYPFTYHHL